MKEKEKVVDIELKKKSDEIVKEAKPIIEYFSKMAITQPVLSESSNCPMCKKYICLCDSQQHRAVNKKVTGFFRKNNVIDDRVMYYLQVIFGITQQDEVERFLAKKRKKLLERASTNEAIVTEAILDKVVIRESEDSLIEEDNWEELAEKGNEIYLNCNDEPVITITKVPRVFIPKAKITSASEAKPSDLSWLRDKNSVYPFIQSSLSRVFLKEFAFAVYLHHDDFGAISTYTGIPMKHVIFLYNTFYFCAEGSDTVNITKELADVVVERCWCEEDIKTFDRLFRRYGKNFESFLYTHFSETKRLWDFQIYYDWILRNILDKWTEEEKMVFYGCFKIFKKDREMYRLIASDSTDADISALPLHHLRSFKINKTFEEIDSFMVFYFKQLSLSAMKSLTEKLVNMEIMDIDKMRIEYIASGRSTRGRKGWNSPKTP